VLVDESLSKEIVQKLRSIEACNWVSTATL